MVLLHVCRCRLNFNQFGVFVFHFTFTDALRLLISITINFNATICFHLEYENRTKMLKEMARLCGEIVFLLPLFEKHSASVLYLT